MLEFANWVNMECKKELNEQVLRCCETTLMEFYGNRVMFTLTIPPFYKDYPNYLPIATSRFDLLALSL